MLHQFRHLYPQGSLLSELVNLDQGLYVVKVTVKNQDIVWGSGLAAAKTVEQAEDQARIRALMTLFTTEVPQVNDNGLSISKIVNPDALPAKINHNHSDSLQSVTRFPHTPPLPNQSAPSDISSRFNESTLKSSTLSSLSANNLAKDPNPQMSQNLNAGKLNAEQASPLEPPSEVVNLDSGKQPINRSSQAASPAHSGNDASISPTFILDSQPESLSSETNKATKPVSASNEITPPQQPAALNIFNQPLESTSTANPNLTTPSATAINSSAQTTAIDQAIEFDFNEIKYKIDLEMKRLGWTSEQGRDYLLSTYGKRSRLHLKDEELLEFWRYLETLL